MVGSELVFGNFRSLTADNVSCYRQPFIFLVMQVHFACNVAG